MTQIKSLDIPGHGHRHRLRTGLDLAHEILRLHQGDAEWAIRSVELERLAAGELTRPDLPDDLLPIWQHLAEIGAGRPANDAVLDAARRLLPAPETQLSEPLRNAPLPDRILGLISDAERLELEEVAKSVPLHDRERLASMLRLEQASDSGMRLLTDTERAAARLHADREAERGHLARLSVEARASGSRLESLAESPANTGLAAPRVFNF